MIHDRSASLLLTLLVGSGLLLIAVILLTVDVVNAPPPSWQQPYGGCDEAWRYPNSAGYAECKAHGLVP